MGLAFLFAQANTTSQTGRQITFLITALLGVAVLLALLTIWYWRHTDPRRREAPVKNTARAEELPRQIVLPQEPEALAQTYAEDDGMSVDEWLSLTGPQSPPQH